MDAGEHIRLNEELSYQLELIYNPKFYLNYYHGGDYALKRCFVATGETISGFVGYTFFYKIDNTFSINKTHKSCKQLDIHLNYHFGDLTKQLDTAIEFGKLKYDPSYKEQKEVLKRLFS